MTLRVINIGSGPNSGDGDKIRDAFDKINLNFSDVAAGALPNVSVSSVAGKTGVVVLDVTDVGNAASSSFVTNSISTVTTAINLKANISDATQTISTGNINIAGQLAVVGNSAFNSVLTVASNTATPAGGSVAAKLVFGTNSGFGIYFGSGAPTVTAGQGSLYMRTDGLSPNTRMYVNTTGSNVWTNFTTAG